MLQTKIMTAKELFEAFGGMNSFYPQDDLMITGVRKGWEREGLGSKMTTVVLCRILSAFSELYHKICVLLIQTQQTKLVRFSENTTSSSEHKTEKETIISYLYYHPENGDFLGEIFHDPLARLSYIGIVVGDGYTLRLSRKTEEEVKLELLWHYLGINMEELIEEEEEEVLSETSEEPFDFTEEFLLAALD